MSPKPTPYARHRAGFPVQIRYGKRRLHSALGHDLSTRGVYLELRAVTLPEGTPVELEIDALGRQWLVEAVVTQTDGGGIKVSFVEPQAQLAAGLTTAGDLPMAPPLPAPRRVPQLQRPGH